MPISLGLAGLCNRGFSRQFPGGRLGIATPPGRARAGTATGRKSGRERVEYGHPNSGGNWHPGSRWARDAGDLRHRLHAPRARIDVEAYPAAGSTPGADRLADSARGR